MMQSLNLLVILVQKSGCMDAELANNRKAYVVNFAHWEISAMRVMETG